MLGHPDVDGETPQHAQAALAAGRLFWIPQHSQHPRAAHAHDVQHAVTVAEAFIANPTHPEEDYADKWSKDRRLETHFLQWHSQAVQDFETLPALMNPVALKAATKRSFQVDLRDDHLRSLGLASAAPAIIITPSRVQISSPSRPWGSVD